MSEPAITVEVAYALPDQQRIIRLTVPAGTTVLQAARLSGITEHFPGVDLEACDMGVFGKQVAQPAERELREGERVELYRPLIADPKEVRKQRAARNKEAARAD